MDRRIRVATVEDAAAIRSIYAPYVESTPITFDVEPPTTAELTERIESGLETHPWLVCETGAGSVVGYVAADELRSMAAYRFTTELSIYVTPDAQSEGVGTGLYSAVLDILTEQGFASAYVAITLPNEASVDFHERMGFEPVGTFPDVGYKVGEWHDVQWWRKPLGERPIDPDPPTAFESLRDGPAVERAIAAGQDRLDRQR